MEVERTAAQFALTAAPYGYRGDPVDCCSSVCSSAAAPFAKESIAIECSASCSCVG